MKASSEDMYNVSQKIPPFGFLNFFPNSWEGIRQVRATLLGARHVTERLWGFLLGVLYQVLDLYLYLLPLIYSVSPKNPPPTVF